MLRHPERPRFHKRAEGSREERLSSARGDLEARLGTGCQRGRGDFVNRLGYGPARPDSAQSHVIIRDRKKTLLRRKVPTCGRIRQKWGTRFLSTRSVE
jgi:hypothetical protein